jgi:hypothetical protein
MRRFALATCLAVVCVMFPLSAAAKEPVISHYSVPADTITVSGVCAFDFRITSTLEITEIDYINASGAVTRVYYHLTEQDTFIGPGRTLVGIPYTANLEFRFNSSGALTGFVASGVFLRVRLPDGTLILSAGRLNILAHPGVTFFFTPDFGHSGNLDALCAALA